MKSLNKKIAPAILAAMIVVGQSISSSALIYGDGKQDSFKNLYKKYCD